MDDEVFVEVAYEPRDLVAARQLGLITRIRDTHVVQFGGFVLLAGAGVLFFAPDPIGRIVASLAGALAGLVVVLVTYGWFRATYAPVRMDKAEELAIEVSDEGVVLKSEDRYMRLHWSDFERIAFGRGVFALMGRATVVIPARILREDQIETLRTLATAHEAEVGSSSLGASPSAEENDAGDGQRKRDDHDGPAM
jgi:hypothetical protein